MALLPMLKVEIFTTMIFEVNFSLKSTLRETVVTHCQVKIGTFKNVVIRLGYEGVNSFALTSLNTSG